MSTKTKSLGDFLQEFSHHRRLMQEELQKIIIGQDEVIQQLFAAIFTRGHCLLEGVPGLAKTLMVSTLAKILDVDFQRIQFTPDLMPSDITGTNVLEEDEAGRREFRFVQGPIFTNILLADEINRTPPKTQAALLQAMQERQVSIGRTTYDLSEPFFTIATQNPIEQEGTYPLPEAQLDRFLLMINLGYPSTEEELAIVENQILVHPIEALEPVASPEQIIEMQEAAKQVYVDDLIKQYIVAITKSTRDHPDISLGSSPRGSLALFRGAQAMAMIRGRNYALPDDVKELAIPMMSHRIIVSAAARMRGTHARDVISGLVDRIPVPGAQVGGWVRR